MTGPDPAPRITPYLLYEDVAAAVTWLSAKFGFSERTEETMRDDAGRILHTAMTFHDGIVMMGCPGPDYQNPKRVGHVTQNLYVVVDDVDAHFARTKAAGATILRALEDTFYGDRRYGVEDLEGHQWYFAQRVKSVAPEDWNPTAEDLEGHG